MLSAIARVVTVASPAVSVSTAELALVAAKETVYSTQLPVVPAVARSHLSSGPVKPSAADACSS